MIDIVLTGLLVVLMGVVAWIATRLHKDIQESNRQYKLWKDEINREIGLKDRQYGTGKRGKSHSHGKKRRA